jgi:hypothetical protein
MHAKIPDKWQKWRTALMNASNEALDLLHISQLIANERHWRDTCQWEKMRNAYHPESMVHVSWFKGSGFAFVEASKSLAKLVQSKHRLSPSRVRLHGERSLVETDTMIEIRMCVAGVEVDTTAHMRLLSRVRRDQGIWRLASLEGIFEKDVLAPVNPAEQIFISSQELRQYRPSYQFLCYLLSHMGRKQEINPDLPGDDKPELVTALYAEAEDWLLNQR